MICYCFVVVLIFQLGQIVCQGFGPDDPETNDGMLGIVPELFDEESDSDISFTNGDSIKEFLSVCKTAKKCEECDAVFRNSRKLQTFNKDTKCDTLAEYNFKRLKLAQYHIQSKKDIVSDNAKAGLYLAAYIICLVLGIYLLIVRQFRFRTLWDKYAHDPTQGMRSFRYERMLFKFDYQDPGANPEDLTGYEDWELYHSSEDEDTAKHYNAMGAIGPEQAMLKKKKQAEREKKEKEKGSRYWPWDDPNYDFSKVPYREGLRRDLDDWKDDDDFHFTSNI
jgi:hypothetical protein